MSAASSRAQILTVIGARPQFVKAAVTSRALARAGLTESLVLTGQHSDVGMADGFLDELSMARPAHVLRSCPSRVPSDATVATSPGTVAAEVAARADASLARMQRSLVELLRRESPSAVLVYGDTDSTLAAARAAHHCGLPLVHVEAGLRSFNGAMREERNRIEADRLSSLLFAPSASAGAQLSAEGIDDARVRVVGDVMLDMFVHVADEIRGGRGPAVMPCFAGRVERRPRVLFTAHRAENVDDAERLGVIVEMLGRLGERADVFWPVHPRTRIRLADHGLEDTLARSGVRLGSPLGYRAIVAAVLDCDVVCTDSGGLQKEAFFGGRPCVTIRDETEWTELVTAGWNRLCPLDGALAATDAVLGAVGTRGETIAPYGDARASARIADELAGWLGRLARSA